VAGRNDSLNLNAEMAGSVRTTPPVRSVRHECTGPSTFLRCRKYPPQERSEAASSHRRCATVRTPGSRRLRRGVGGLLPPTRGRERRLSRRALVRWLSVFLPVRPPSSTGKVRRSARPSRRRGGPDEPLADGAAKKRRSNAGAQHPAAVREAVWTGWLRAMAQHPELADNQKKSLHSSASQRCLPAGQRCHRRGICRWLSPHTTASRLSSPPALTHGIRRGGGGARCGQSPRGGGLRCPAVLVWWGLQWAQPGLGKVAGVLGQNEAACRGRGLRTVHRRCGRLREPPAPTCCCPVSVRWGATFMPFRADLASRGRFVGNGLQLRCGC